MAPFSAVLLEPVKSALPPVGSQKAPKSIEYTQKRGLPKEKRNTHQHKALKGCVQRGKVVPISSGKWVATVLRTTPEVLLPMHSSATTQHTQTEQRMSRVQKSTSDSASLRSQAPSVRHTTRTQPKIMNPEEYRVASALSVAFQDGNAFSQSAGNW